MDEWATSNRIGGQFSYYIELTPELVKLSLQNGTPLRVRIKEGTRYYQQGLDGQQSNPVNVTGTIIESYGRDGVRVRWDNGITNGYDYVDLEIVK